VTNPDREAHELVMSAGQQKRKETLEMRQDARNPKRSRTLQQKRGEGEVYDVIDEWLAPLLARSIANQYSPPSPKLKS
jgi:hypothetical protein